MFFSNFADRRKEVFLICVNPLIAFQSDKEDKLDFSLADFFDKQTIDDMLLYQRRFPFDYLPKYYFNKYQGVKSYNYKILQIPCYKCIQCRIQYSKEWAARCILESKLYDKNCFVTLTYAPEHLPASGSLVQEHVQKFLKRLRFKYGAGIRYFYCGEYGTQRGRPHYHLLLFNFDFPDKIPFFKSGANVVYRSPSLENLWTYGISSTGELTFESAAYVARYIIKKQYGEDADYNSLGIMPEYTRMSLRPAVGKPWFDKYYRDVYNHDFIAVTENIKIKPPRYFDRQYQLIDEAHFDKIKKERIIRSCDVYFDHPEEFSPARISEKAKYLEIITSKLPRNYESR